MDKLEFLEYLENKNSAEWTDEECCKLYFLDEPRKINFPTPYAGFTANIKNSSNFWINFIKKD